MEFKGKQGELSVEFIDEDFFVSINSEKGSVASISTREDTYEEAKYYGVLFSKAPEILEMLIEIYDDVECFNDLPESQQLKIKELIKQATEI